MQGSPVWFVTGASSGLGRAIGEAALAAGGRLVATARDPATLAPLTAIAPERVLALPLDVTDPATIDVAVSAAIARFGAIDILVNNAGIGFLAAIEEGGDAEMRRLFDVNVFGLAGVTRAVLPAMRARGSGTIVAISSMSGFRASPGVGYYAASKWAVEALAESLSREVAPLGLRVLIVEPGPFRTDFAGRSMLRPARTIAAYETAAAVRAGSNRTSGQEPGDPARGAALIVETVLSADAPLRLVLGTMAQDGICAALEERLGQVRAHAALAARA